MVILEDEEKAAEENTTLILEPMDCAIVFRDRGDDGITPEISLPNYENGESIVSVAATMCSIVAMRMGDDKFIKECYDWFDAKMVEINAKIKEAEPDDES